MYNEITGSLQSDAQANDAVDSQLTNRSNLIGYEQVIGSAA